MELKYQSMTKKPYLVLAELLPLRLLSMSLCYEQKMLRSVRQSTFLLSLYLQRGLNCVVQHLTRGFCLFPPK